MPPIEIRIRRGTASYLAEQNDVLAAGEPCLEIDTGKVKYGDGITPWNQLAYAATGDELPGTNNEVTGIDGLAAGGSDNLASGTASAALSGKNNTASGAQSVTVGGNANTAAGVNSVTLGGNTNTANGLNSIAGGKNAVTTKDAQFALSAGSFFVPGDAQFSIYNLRAATENDVPTRMYINGTAGNLTLTPGAAWAFEVRVSAYDVSATTSGAWTIRGSVFRDYANNVSLSGAPVVEVIAEEWPEGSGVEVTADNVNKALAVTVTGPVAHQVQWVATVIATELISPEPLTSDMFVEIAANAAVNSLAVTVDGNSMEPEFDPAIYDYVVWSNTDFYSSSERDYSVTINNDSPVTGTATVNKALRVKIGATSYFIRILPSDFPALPTIVTKTNQYIPGYYIAACTQAIGPYMVIYNSNGVPVWYTYNDESLCEVISLHAGWDTNKLITNGNTNNCDRWDIHIGLNELTAKPYTMINPDGKGRSNTWEIHESHAIKGPANRKGNIIYEAYTGPGFYIQEQNPQNQIVWEWWTEDYFGNQWSEFYHINSVDVHPITGNIVVSCRHNSAVFAIDYETKEVIWVIEGAVECTGGGSLWAARILNMTQNTKLLTLEGEPAVSGSQYVGPDSQHDARWHLDVPPLTPGNDIVSISDNQTCSSRPARGVVYEIDLVNSRAINRMQVNSPYGNTGCCGSFTLLKENNTTYSGTMLLNGDSPNTVEFNLSLAGVNQGVVFEMNLPGAWWYRAIKARSDFFNLNYLRTTAGRIPTIIGG
jgi:hypothetical protein